MGEKLKKLLILQNAAKSFQMCSELVPLVLTKLLWGFLKFCSLRFLLENFKFTTVANGGIKKLSQLPQLSAKQEIVEQNGVKFGTRV